MGPIAVDDPMARGRQRPYNRAAGEGPEFGVYDDLGLAIEKGNNRAKRDCRSGPVFPQMHKGGAEGNPQSVDIPYLFITKVLEIASVLSRITVIM